ncbi:Inositol-tetrakisphosphate 1-kinase 2 [Nymphaea thermarum]|nr:Inositol-tetrakisphosphate 1-kinase 2 [Nymphaea thermarum]
MRLGGESVMVSPRISVGHDWNAVKIDAVAEPLKVPYRNDGEWGEKEERNGGLYSLGIGHVPSLPSQQKPVVVVGYALTAKKIKSFLRPTFEALARKNGIVFVAIDQSQSLLDQGPFDIILHKEYRKKHPEVIILDPPYAIEHLHNRQSMLQDVADLNLCDQNGKIGVPRQLTIYGDPASIPDAVNRAGLRLPLVAKPLVVDGTAKSHELSLAYDQSSLSKLEPPLVLQEFVNHGGVLFKVYIVGETIKVVRRFSLPDVEDSETLHSVGVIQFPRVSSSAASADNAELDPCVSELPPVSLLEKLGRELRHRLGLQLFNIDIIREHGTRDCYFVIDINYFPGFGKMPEYEQVFTEFLLSLGQSKMTRCPAVNG